MPVTLRSNVPALAKNGSVSVKAEDTDPPADGDTGAGSKGAVAPAG